MKPNIAGGTENSPNATAMAPAAVYTKPVCVCVCVCVRERESMSAYMDASVVAK
jgi:hypothetical protein